MKINKIIFLVLVSLLLMGCAKNPTGNFVKEVQSTGDIKEITIDSYNWRFTLYC